MKIYISRLPSHLRRSLRETFTPCERSIFVRDLGSIEGKHVLECITNNYSTLTKWCLDEVKVPCDRSVIWIILVYHAKKWDALIDACFPVPEDEASIPQNPQTQKQAFRHLFPIPISTLYSITGPNNCRPVTMLKTIREFEPGLSRRILNSPDLHTEDSVDKDRIVFTLHQNGIHMDLTSAISYGNELWVSYFLNQLSKHEKEKIKRNLAHQAADAVNIRVLSWCIDSGFHYDVAYLNQCIGKLPPYYSEWNALVMFLLNRNMLQFNFAIV